MYIAAASWAEKPVSQNVTANDNVTFHCRGAETPEYRLRVEWFINGRRLAGEFVSLHAQAHTDTWTHGGVNKTADEILYNWRPHRIIIVFSAVCCGHFYQMSFRYRHVFGRLTTSSRG